MAAYTCIYCLDEKDAGAFNKEHVIPQALGTFRDNQTLINTVCAECNAYFSRELELYLARDTPIGLDRFVRGLRPASEFKPFGNSTMENRVASGPFRGVQTKAIPGDPLNQVPLPHIALSNGSDRHWFRVDALPSAAELKDLLERGFRDIEFLEVDPGPVLEELSKRGAKPEGQVRQFREGPWTSQEHFETKATFGFRFGRAVAKVAFNYFAYRYGGSTARMAQFNEVRQFIRDGTVPTLPVWRMERASLISNEPATYYGHTIVLEAVGETLFAVVAFNENVTHHRVALARGGFLIRGFLKAGGHHFDLNSRRISDVYRLRVASSLR